MRILSLIIAVAGSYLILRGWEGAPGLIMRACLSVATLVAGLAFWSSGKRSGLPRMFCMRRANLLDYLSLGAAIVFIEACFVVITSTLAAPAQNLADAFYHFSSGIEPSQAGSSNGEPQLGGTRSGNWLFTSSLERNLPPSSNHKPSNRPEIFVELTEKESAQRLLASRIHLRSFAMSRFDGVTWSAKRLPARQIEAPVSFPRTDHSRVRSPILQHKIFHAANPTGQNVLVTLQGAISTDISPLTQLSDSIHLLPPPKDITSGYEYSAVSRPVHFTDLIGENPEVAEADPTYLELAENALTERIRTTAEPFSYEDGLTAQLLALRLFLLKNYQYSLETKNSSGMHPVENFLYQEKRGYCEHFATSTVLICRALGVPSRIAYGWSGGKLYPAQNLFVFRAKDAHAWAEIKLKGYGWVVFDTTPPDANEVPTAFSASENETAPDPLDATTTQSPDISSDDEDTALTLPADFNYTRLVAALCALALCCAFFLTARYLKRPNTDAEGKPIHSNTPGYLLQFKQASSSLGQPMPQGRTLRQQLRILSESGAAPSFASDLLDYHYGILYGETDRSTSREKSLARAIRAWVRDEQLG